VAAAGTYTLTVEATGTNQDQGNCSYTEPAVVGTFANFHETDVYKNSNSSSTYASVGLTDERDNKNYPVVKLGGRWIMARNLNYQGTSGANTLTWRAESKSPSIVSGSGSATIGSFWCPGKNSTTSSDRKNCDVWGALYSWETAMMVDGKWTSSAHSSSSWSEPSSYGSSTVTANTQNHARSDAGGVTGGRGICPPNWHVPTDGEWGDLLNAIETGTKEHNSKTGSIGAYAGEYCKSACNCSSATYCDTDNGVDAVTSWYGGTSSKPGSDSFAFRVLPAGYRTYNGASLNYRGAEALFWSSTASAGHSAWFRQLSFDQATVYRYFGYYRSHGFSVRCIRD
jgi:uncharacterized protein (TIGR02145 family)